MKKIVFAAMFLLAGCSSTLPAQDTGFIGEETETEMIAAYYQENVPTYINVKTKEEQSHKNAQVRYTENTHEPVFSLLDRNDKQVKRIYRESTIKITPDDDYVPSFANIEEMKKKLPDVSEEYLNSLEKKAE